MPLLVAWTSRRYRFQHVGHQSVGAQTRGEGRQPIAPDSPAVAARKAHNDVGVVAEAGCPVRTNRMRTNSLPSSCPQPATASCRATSCYDLQGAVGKRSLKRRAVSQVSKYADAVRITGITRPDHDRSEDPSQLPSQMLVVGLETKAAFDKHCASYGGTCEPNAVPRPYSA